MKKLLLTLTLISTTLIATSTDIEIKIMNKISTALTNKKLIFVHTEDNKNLDIVFKSEILRYSSVCDKANIVITNTTELKKCSQNKLIFATGYLSFEALPNAVGAFFYKKGRPSIVFRKDVLEKHNITLPKEFSKYIK